MSQNLSQRLKELREQHGYSQETLASELFVSRQAISQWENGKSSPDIDKLIALTQLYNISMDELLLLEKKNDPSSKKTNCNIQEKPSSVILNQIELAVISILSAQFSFVSIVINLYIIYYIRKKQPGYKISFFLCIICLLIGCYNSFVFITHMMSN